MTDYRKRAAHREDPPQAPEELLLDVNALSGGGGDLDVVRARGSPNDRRRFTSQPSWRHTAVSRREP